MLGRPNAAKTRQIRRLILPVKSKVLLRIKPRYVNRFTLALVAAPMGGARMSGKGTHGFLSS